MVQDLWYKTMNLWCARFEDKVGRICGIRFLSNRPWIYGTWFEDKRGKVCGARFQDILNRISNQIWQKLDIKIDLVWKKHGQCKCFMTYDGHYGN